MATVEECEAALQTIAARLGNADAATRDRIDQRSLACHITDLNVTFIGQLRDGGLHDIVRAEPAGNEVRMELTSDDLIALVDGNLNLAAAWATGRLKIHAGMRDLLKLRSFF